MDSRPAVRASWLGRVEYRAAYDLQRRLYSRKLEGQEADWLLLLEHPPTLTLGKSGKLENLLVQKEELARQGVSLFFTDRGGDITYHGPGQLVAYPILDLNFFARDVHLYVHSLQEVIVRTLADYSIHAGRDEEYVGVWVGSEKIAAIGVAIHRWITTHGLALNVDPLMEHFRLISPCGIHDRGVTSMARLLGHDVPVRDVATTLARHFSGVFQSDIEWVEPSLLIGSDKRPANDVCLAIQH